jgi:ABC-type phosphate/phosphonate transport system substrate-binding protein
MFDALPTLPAALAHGFVSVLLAMSWENPRHRKILELEGLKQWLPPRPPGDGNVDGDGYASLRAALDRAQGW